MYDRAMSNVHFGAQGSFQRLSESVYEMRVLLLMGCKMKVWGVNKFT